MELVAQLVKRMLDLVLQVREIGPSIPWSRGRHDELDSQLGSVT